MVIRTYNRDMHSVSSNTERTVQTRQTEVNNYSVGIIFRFVISFSTSCSPPQDISSVTRQQTRTSLYTSARAGKG